MAKKIKMALFKRNAIIDNQVRVVWDIHKIENGYVGKHILRNFTKIQAEKWARENNIILTRF